MLEVKLPFTSELASFLFSSLFYSFLPVAVFIVWVAVSCFDRTTSFGSYSMSRAKVYLGHW